MTKENNTNSSIAISSLGIDSHQDNGYYSDSDTHQYEFNIWKTGTSGYLQLAVYYAIDPSITIPENGTYNVSDVNDSEGDFSFIYINYLKHLLRNKWYSYHIEF